MRAPPVKPIAFAYKECKIILFIRAENQSMTQAMKSFVPDFIVAGATRCGTTTLHEALNVHPDFCLPLQKETLFFYMDKLFSQGIEAYEQNFSHYQSGQKRGEICPLYMDQGFVMTHDGPSYQPDDDCAARIAKTYPDVPIILSLRNPVTRAYSIYCKSKWQGKETAQSFEQAIGEELNGKRTPEQTQQCYLWRNLYYKHLQNWLRYYDRSQIHIVIFEEWIKNPQIIIELFGKLLDVNPASWDLDAFKPSNEGRQSKNSILDPIFKATKNIKPLQAMLRRVGTQKGYQPLNPDAKEKLQEYFAQDIKALEDYIQRPIACWYNQE